MKSGLLSSFKLALNRGLLPVDDWKAFNLFSEGKGLKFILGNLLKPPYSTLIFL